MLCTSTILDWFNLISISFVKNKRTERLYLEILTVIQKNKKKSLNAVIMKIANEDNTNITVNCSEIYIIFKIYETMLKFPISMEVAKGGWSEWEPYLSLKEYERFRMYVKRNGFCFNVQLLFNWTLLLNLLHFHCYFTVVKWTKKLKELNAKITVTMFWEFTFFPLVFFFLNTNHHVLLQLISTILKTMSEIKKH